MKSSPPKNPAFHSADLATAVSAIHDHVVGYKNTLDQISEDIRNLESYLMTSGVNIPIRLGLRDDVRHRAGEMELDFGSGFILFLPDSVDGRPIEVVREVLLWDRDPSGTFRLLYQRSIHDGVMDIDGDGSKPYRVEATPRESEVRPLIETKLDVRLRLYGWLPEFVKEVGQRLSPAAVFTEDALLAALRASSGTRNGSSAA